MVSRNASVSGTRREINPERERMVPAWAHPGMKYWFDDWRLIRDCIEGERDIKDSRDVYLPRLDNMTQKEYAAYIDRGVFYNFTGRTLGALVGTLFRRKPRIHDLPKALEKRLETFSKTGSPWEVFAETSAEEYLAVGRFGVLIDLPAVPSSTPQPYAVPYVAENIMDWDYEVDPETGRQRLSYVLLREWTRGTDAALKKYRWFTRYRKLALEGEARDPVTGEWTGKRFYVQYEYARPDADAQPTDTGTRKVVMVRGETVDFIPFHLFDAARPPMLDIARLNISHYRSYTHLEHGRYFTGLPIYVATTPQGGQSQYYLGPSVVWELPMGGEAKILEFNGNGLRALDEALRSKEAQASALGGRLIGVTAQSTAETDNQTAEKGRNEQATLHRASRHLDHGWTIIMRWWCNFANEPSEDVAVKFNKDFLYDAIGSREFRAIQSMYKDGIIGIDIVHNYLVKAGVIDDDISVDDLKAALESAESFPNNPDFKARQEGYPDRQSQINDENKDWELEIKEDEAGAKVDQVENAQKNADLDRKEAEKARKDAAKNAAAAPRDAGVMGQRQQLQQQGNTAPPAPRGQIPGGGRPPPRGPRR